MELETKLVIRSHDPRRVIDNIVARADIGGFPLGPAENRKIHDVYVDTESLDLAASYSVLRIRCEGTDVLITFKGPSSRSEDGFSERTEIELPWSEESLAEVMDVVPERTNVRFHEQLTGPFTNPMETLSRLGFKTIQDRITERFGRLVYNTRDGMDEPMAELDCDSVTYRFSGVSVRHHEIEVELFGSVKTKDADKFVRALIAEYQDEITPWPLGKVTTGVELEKLFREGKLDSFVADGQLVPEVYEELEQRTADRGERSAVGSRMTT